MESYNLSILHELGKLLRVHNESHYCFYALSFKEYHEFSLSKYLGITMNELHTILVAQGMGNYAPNGSFCINSKNFCNFLELQGMGGKYFDKMEVKGVTKKGKKEW